MELKGAGILPQPLPCFNKSTGGTGFLKQKNRARPVYQNMG
jgi:hypothetical protein